MLKSILFAMSLVISTQAFATSPLSDESLFFNMSSKEKATAAAVAIIPKIQALLSGNSDSNANIFALYQDVKCHSTPKSVSVDEKSRKFKVVLRCGEYRPVIVGYIGDGDTQVTGLSVSQR